MDHIINDRQADGLLLEKMELGGATSGVQALVCNCDLTASKVIAQLTAAGIKVPDDVSVTGYDNFLSPAEKTIPLTTVAVSPEKTAGLAAELIISKITGRDYIKGRHLVSGEIIERESVMRLSGQAR